MTDNPKKPSINAFGIVVSAGGIYVAFALFGSILTRWPQNQYMAFAIMMGILAVIAGSLIGTLKNTKRIPTSLIAGVVTSLLYFFTSIPSRAADLNMFILVFCSATIPMALATWLVSTLRKK